MREETKIILDKFIDRINGKPVRSNDGFGEYETELKFDTFEERFACYDMLNGRIWAEYGCRNMARICVYEFIEASYWLNREVGSLLDDPARKEYIKMLTMKKRAKQ